MMDRIARWVTAAVLVTGCTETKPPSVAPPTIHVSATAAATSAPDAASATPSAAPAPSPATSAATGSAYTPPKTTTVDGWEVYIDPVVYTPETSVDLKPDLHTPEAAVLRFLASQARGDDDYLRTLVAGGDSRLTRKLEQWASWKVLRFQLVKKHTVGDEIGVQVDFLIEYDGKQDGGKDEFTVVEDSGEWRVLYPPT